MTDRDKEVEKQLLQNEKAALDELKQAYTQALADVKAEVKELQKDPDIQSKIYQLKYQQALEEQLNTIVEILNDSSVTTANDFLQKMYRDGYAGIIYSMQGYGIPLSTPINQELLIKAVTTSTDSIKISQRLYDNVQQFKKDIISEISRGLASSADYKTIALYIAAKGKTSFNNAYRIARTEGHRTAMQAKADSITAARSRGADMVKVWDATLDGKTRASHARLHGQWKEDGEEFATYDDKGNEISTQYPGGFGIAEQDINCRCTLLSMPRWALSSETTYHLDNITDEIIEASSYDEWLKKYYSVDNSSESGIINLTDDEYTAINKYISSDFYPINAKIRSDMKLTDYEAKLVADVETALDKMPTYSGNLSRSVHFDDEKDLSAFLDEHEVGSTVTYKAFTSTTKGSVYNENANVQIYIRNAKSGADISRYNVAEQEIIYKMNSSFIVEDVGNTGDTIHIFLKEN